MKFSLDYILYARLLLLIAGVTGTITDGPLNAVAEVGGQAIFNCTSDKTVQNWVFSAKREDIGTSHQDIASNCVVQTGYTTHYEVDRPGGSNNKCSLIVKDTTLQQAGVYTCTDTVPGPSALLTVIDKSSTTYNDTQGVVMENENVTITCTLHHSGSAKPAPTLRPYFYWTDSSGQNVSSSYNSTTENLAVSQLTVIAGRQDIPSYTCHTYLKLEPPTTAGYANNTPPVNKNITSPTVIVLYGPSSPNVTSQSKSIMIEGISCEVSSLTCSSSGNPAPNYYWLDSKENANKSVDKTFDLAEINRNYTCVAYNVIRNKEFKRLSFYAPTSGNTINACRFPRSDSTWINVTACDNGTCHCSNGYDGLIFTCNTDSYPNASYKWTRADNKPIYSKVYRNVTINGLYGCTAYFNQSFSNYLGSATFTNGTKLINISDCCPEWKLIVSVIIPWIGECLIATIIFIVCFATLVTPFRAKMLSRFPWLDYMLPYIKKPKGPNWKIFVFVALLVVVSVTCGIVFFPILITIAYFSTKSKGEATDSQYENSGATKPKSAYLIPLIILMWVGVVVFMFPLTFVLVYFVHCEQMTFRYVVTP